MKYTHKNLLLRYFYNFYTELDFQKLMKISSAQEKDSAFRNSMHSHWEEFTPGDDLPVKDFTELLKRINTEISRESKFFFIKKSINYYSKIAGILIPLLIIGASIWHVQFRAISKKESSLVEVHCPLGSKLSLYLPDGSRVWLNSESVIKYSNVFRHNRYTEVIGEAYFTVRTDTSNPFYVKVGEINLRVTGTEFNVSSYKEDNTIEVVLAEGRVELTNEKDETFLKMEPDQKVIYDKTTNKYQILKVNSENYYEWIKGNLIFRNITMVEVAAKLERWYNIDVEILDEELKQLRYHASFTDEGLIETLNLLKATSTMDYQIQERKLENSVFTKTKILITKEKI